MIRRMTRAKEPTGQTLPKPLLIFRAALPPARVALAGACLAALALGGCATTTTKKTADATPVARAATARESIALGPKAAPGSPAVPPVVLMTHGSARLAVASAARSATPAAASAAIPTPENTFPPAPAAPGQQQGLLTPQQPTNLQGTSIAGLATQPTGVRADATTIYSTSQQMPVADPSATGPVPANLPSRNFNAMTASVYSLRPAAQVIPTPSVSCTTAQGAPISC